MEWLILLIVLAGAWWLYVGFVRAMGGGRRHPPDRRDKESGPD
jgi:hypothetical protein